MCFSGILSSSEKVSLLLSYPSQVSCVNWCYLSRKYSFLSFSLYLSKSGGEWWFVSQYYHISSQFFWYICQFVTWWSYTCSSSPCLSHLFCRSTPGGKTLLVHVLHQFLLRCQIRSQVMIFRLLFQKVNANVPILFHLLLLMITCHLLPFPLLHPSTMSPFLKLFRKSCLILAGVMQW